MQIFFNVLVNNQTTRVKYIGFNLKDPINDTFMFNKEKFRISSVIFHEGWGGTIDSGHFVNLLRYKNGWVKTSDKIVKTEPWSTNGRQPYLIFLEKVIENRDTNNKIIEKYIHIDNPSPNSLNTAQKRKEGENSSIQCPNEPKKICLDNQNGSTLKETTDTYQFLSSCENKLPSNGTATSESNKASLSTPSTGESGEKIVFDTQLKLQRKKALRNRDYYKNNRLEILSKKKKKVFEKKESRN